MSVSRRGLFGLMAVAPIAAVKREDAVVPDIPMIDGASPLEDRLRKIEVRVDAHRDLLREVFTNDTINEILANTGQPA